nr:M48 family metalloprotease [Chloroflexota bacterium]
MNQQDQTPIEFPGLDVQKAKRYSKVRLGFFLVGVLVTTVQSVWFAFSGRSAALRKRADSIVPHRGFATPLYITLVTLAGWAAHLPLGFLSGHVVERRFGQTKQRWTGWLGDEAKGVGVGVVLQVPLITGAYAVIKRRPKDWWLVLSAATLPLSVVLGHLAPVLIMPLFNTYTPLRDRELAERIKGLAARSGVRIVDVYEMDMSRQTEKANAFFAGLGNTKRIVLSDTLINQFSYEEIEAVVAHELGHQVHGDIWRLIGFATLAGGVSTFAVQR